MTVLVCSVLHVNNNVKACYSKMTWGFYAVVSPESQTLKDPVCGICQAAPRRTCEFPFADAPVAPLLSFHIQPTEVKNI